MALNRCIHERYRQKDFSINYAILNDCEISDIIELQHLDKVLKVGMDSTTHRTQVNKKYPYPNEDYIINQLGEIELLRIAGFHAYDCCDKIAKRAYEKGIDTLVDEDLTQFFQMIFQDKDFKYDSYPSVNPKKGLNKELWRNFLENRKDKPWFLQDFNW